MATFTAENRAAWQKIADSASAQRPSVGKTVEIVGGRKYKGQVGVVVWHGVDKYSSTQYLSDARLALREINGREGYRVAVKTATETFFVPADYTLVKEESK